MKQDRHVVGILPHVYPADVYFIARNLREADRRELETISGRSALEAVWVSWAASERTWVATIHGEPAVVFGVGQGGVVWMVGTDAISKAKVEVFKLSQRILGELLDMYGYLHNFVDERNTLHVRWLKRLGFTFDGSIEINKLRFLRFFMKREE